MTNGWGAFFSKKKDALSSIQPKTISSHPQKVDVEKLPFPGDFQYGPGDLEKVINYQKNASPMDQLIAENVGMIKETYKGLLEELDLKYPIVKWEDGRLSFHIGSFVIPDTADAQVAKLLYLQKRGYDIPTKFSRLIEKTIGNDCVNKSFAYSKPDNRDDYSFFQVKDFYFDADDIPFLLIQSYSSSNLEGDQKTNIPFRSFLSDLEKDKVHQLSSSEKKLWEAKKEQIAKSRNDFRRVCDLYGHSHKERKLASGQDFKGSDGSIYEPLTWSVGSYNGNYKITVQVRDQNVNITSMVEFDEQSCFHYPKLLHIIRDSIKEDECKEYIHILLELFGKPYLGGYKTALPTNIRDNDKKLYNQVFCSSDKKINLFYEAGDEYREADADNIDIGLLLREVYTICDKKFFTLNKMKREANTNQELSQISVALGVLETKLYKYKDRKDSTITDMWRNFSKEIGYIPGVYNIEEETSSEEDTSQEAPGADQTGQTSEKPSEDDTETTTIETDNKEGENDSSTGSVLDTQEETEEAENDESLDTEEIYVDPVSLPNSFLFRQNRKRVYYMFAKLISNKLKQQKDSQDTVPWINSSLLPPSDKDGNPYDGINSIMLSMYMDEHNLTFPRFLTVEQIKDKGLKVRNTATGMFIMLNNEVLHIYNYDETNYKNSDPEGYHRMFENIKVALGAMEPQFDKVKKAGSGIDLTISGTGVPLKPVYIKSKNLAQIGSEDKYADDDDVYCSDLSVALIEGIRKVDFAHLDIENALEEELIAYIGTAMIGRKCNFDATSNAYSERWVSLLTSNDKFTQKVLTKALEAAQKVV